MLYMDLSHSFTSLSSLQIKNAEDLDARLLLLLGNKNVVETYDLNGI